MFTLLQNFQNIIDAADAPLDRAAFGGFHAVLKRKIQQAGGLMLETDKRFRSLFPHVGVRIITQWQCHDLDAEAAVDEQIQPPERSPDPGSVRVEQQHHLRGESAQHLYVLKGKRGAEGRDGMSEACLM